MTIEKEDRTVGMNIPPDVWIRGKLKRYTIEELKQRNTYYDEYSLDSKIKYAVRLYGLEDQSDPTRKGHYMFFERLSILHCVLTSFKSDLMLSVIRLGFMCENGIWEHNGVRATGQNKAVTEFVKERMKEGFE